MTYAVYGTIAYPYGTATRYYGMGADTVTRWGIDIDWDGDGIYNGGNDGLYAVAYKSDRGRTQYLNINSDGDAAGFEPIRVGSATLTLDNTSRRYDPYNTSSPLYPNVLPGRYIRIRCLYNGVIYDVFHGKIRNITSIDNGNIQQTRLELEDGLRLLQASNASVAIQSGININAAINMVLNDINYPAIFGTNIESSNDILSYWWAEKKAAEECRSLAEAELGQFFVAADGNATFFSRHHTSAPTLTLTSGDFLKEVDVPFPLEIIRNYIKFFAHPRTVIASGALWTMGDIPQIAAGGSLTVWASYAYNNSATPAINVISPVATTDYTANTQSDGLGTNLTASFSVTLTDFGKTGKIIIRNNHATLSGYVTLMKVRGQALYAPDPSLLIQSSTASQAIYGKTLLTMDSDWMQDTSLANDLCLWLISFMSSPQKFLTVRLEARPDIQFTPDLFDIINVTINRLSISGVNYRVAGIEQEWISTNGQAVRTTWILEPNADISGFWQFTTQLDVTARFGI